MKLCNRIGLLLLLCGALFTGPAAAQDLFDRTHTESYAEFLFRSGNYLEAAGEYERLVFSFGADDNSRLKLVQSYRLGGKPYIASDRMRSLWDNPDQVSQAVSKELLTLYIMNEDFEGFDMLARRQTLLPQNERLFFMVSARLFQNDFHEAHELLTENRHNDQALQAYLMIVDDALAMRAKSPVVGGILSALVPGTGKMYAGNWQDGFISMSIVGVSAWQAYRGFEKRGVSSVYGWIYAALGAAFHAGNIYGSIKEVNRYNQLQTKHIRIRVQAVFYNRL